MIYGWLFKIRSTCKNYCLRSFWAASHFLKLPGLAVLGICLARCWRSFRLGIEEVRLQARIFRISGLGFMIGSSSWSG